MLNDIRYIRGQLRALVQVGNDCSPAECADRISRALDALDRVESAARQVELFIARVDTSAPVKWIARVNFGYRLTTDRDQATPMTSEQLARAARAMSIDSYNLETL